MSERRKRFVGMLGRVLGFAFSCVLPALVGFTLGYHRGEQNGRLEMKCAFMAIFERLDHAEPAPGTVTFGCKKAGS